MSESSTVSQMTIYDPLKNGIEELGLSTRPFNALKRVGINSIVELVKMSQESLLEVRNLGPESVEEINSRLRQYLEENLIPEEHLHSILTEMPRSHEPSAPKDETINPSKDVKLSRWQTKWLEVRRDLIAELDAGKLHPNISFRDSSLVDWLKTFSIKQSETNLKAASNVVNHKLSLKTINDELMDFVSQMNIRHLDILVSRFGDSSETLQEIAGRMVLTRERIRQLETRAKKMVTTWLKKFSPWRIMSALWIADEMGEQISWQRWKDELERRGLLEQKSVFIDSTRHRELGALELLLVLLKANEDADVPASSYSLNEHLKTALEHRGFAADEIAVAKSLSKKELRMIRRQCRNSGAVSAILVSRQIKESLQTVKNALRLHGYTELDSEWLTLPPNPKAISSGFRNSAFRFNVAKMLAVCGSLHVGDVKRGIEQHASRLGFTVPPKVIFAQILSAHGFQISDNNQVLPIEGAKAKLNSSEQVVLDLIRKNGPVVTFNELSDEFQRMGLSQPALSVTLKHSVLFQRVDVGFYCLYGTQITREDVEKALTRQHRIAQESELRFFSDGIVVYEVNIGSYGRGGTIASGQAKRLSGEWKSVSRNQIIGQIKVYETYISGLGKIFRILGITVGDRIALHFDTRTRRVRVKKVRGRDEED